MKEKKAEMSIEERVYQNRESLKKQDAWACKVAKKDHMERVTIEECRYGGGKWERLDVICPKDREEKLLPVLFYIHGGGWIAGNKEARRVYCGKFADSGYIVVNIEYELAPEAQFPVAIGQCIRAVDYILDRAKDYGMDTSRIALGGESAGAFYAAFVAAIAKDKTILKKLGLPAMRHSEFDVKVNMFNCGAVDLKKMLISGFPNAELMVEAYTGYSAKEIRAGKRDRELDEISPLSYIRSDFPPTFMIYGSWDSLRYNTFEMRQLMETYHIPHEVYRGRGLFYGQHTTAMILKSKKAFQIFDITLSYMNRILF